MFQFSLPSCEQIKIQVWKRYKTTPSFNNEFMNSGITASKSLRTINVQGLDVAGTLSAAC